jgi:hypothetical protein
MKIPSKSFVTFASEVSFVDAAGDLNTGPLIAYNTEDLTADQLATLKTLSGQDAIQFVIDTLVVNNFGHQASF